VVANEKARLPNTKTYRWKLLKIHLYLYTMVKTRNI